MTVQGLVVGPVTKALGDRKTMLLGLIGGTCGIAMMGWAPTGWMFVAAMLPNALWGLAMPTLQSLMTRQVSESEQGQLQGATMSVASIAGVASPLFFGWIYSLSVGGGFAPLTTWLDRHGLGVIDAIVHAPGLSFYISALVLALAGIIAWITARRAEPRRTGFGAGREPELIQRGRVRLSVTARRKGDEGSVFGLGLCGLFGWRLLGGRLLRRSLLRRGRLLGGRSLLLGRGAGLSGQAGAGRLPASGLPARFPWAGWR